jgi:hypothetical protein
MGGKIDLFEKEKAQINKTIDLTLKKTAEYTIDKLTIDAPVWKGDFVGMMTVETSAKSYPRLKTRTPPPYPPSLPESIAGMMRKQANANLKSEAKALIKAGKHKIAFNNRAKHAVFVEFTGWPPTKEAYFTFAKAQVSTQEEKKKIGANAKRKVFK